ncbi:class I SAM-dependent DNA methyltransferase [uncultured Pontibacter sp.]|uniref:type I restriction-modification system subunit M n=1 Tax=uncultured Pontibacter sp. TaxID=453356 RepID=UPI0026180548|nr:class I SAM-dependent DNA methyltransferase [uncultured Pontibacter sp.]
MADKRPTIDFIFRITNDVLWNTFKKNEIGDVMLPFVVLRRLDCILEPQKQAVRDAYLNFKDKVQPDKLGPILERAAGGLKYYNTSPYDLRALTQDAQNVEINFRAYINGFSPNVTEIMEHYQLDKVVARLVKNNLLYEMVAAIAKVDLHTSAVSNHDMGYVFEELIRISNEQSNQTAGEHFTPREVIRLMASVIFSTEKEELKQTGVIRTIYDLACGTGGMLTLSKHYVHEHINKDASLNIFGQEINEQSYAIAKSDLLITGENPDNIRHGNSFSNDRFPDRKFNYMLANPPYGVSWKKDEIFIKHEALNPMGRFNAGLPRTSDGQFLFIQHMISKMDPQGSRIGIVTNGSPLFTGDAGSGESEIRKWIISNDWLDAIIALPSDIFYNTGIYTYIWVVTNKKQPHRKGKVQLINATDLYVPMKKSLNFKRKRISDDQIKEITRLYEAFEEGPQVKIFDNESFGYFQVTIEQPVRKNGKVVLDKNGEPKADSKKRDTENIPLNENIEEYFVREVKPHVPDAWIDFSKTRIGYEINFTKYFYQYQKPDDSAKLKVEIQKLEESIVGLLEEILND